MTGNGRLKRFRVSFSGKIVKVIQELKYEAFLTGQSVQFETAWKTILERLRTDPFGFGELIDYHANLKLKEHVASVFPITITFGVHDELPMVIISRVIYHSPA